MNKLQEIEKKNQQLKEKFQKEKETVSRLKKENTLLRKELQDIKILLENSPAGIVLLWHGRVLEVNDTFLGFMGYKADEMINRNFLNFIHPDNLSEVRFIHNKWSAGKTGRGHYDTRFITDSDDAVLCSVEARRVRYRGRASYLLNITRLEEREENHKRERFDVRNITELRIAEGVKSLLDKRSEVILDILGFVQSSRELYGKNLDQVIKKLKSEHGNILKEIRMLKAITSEKVEYRDKKVIDINQIIDEAVNRITRTDEAGEIDIKKFLRASASLSGRSAELAEALTQLLLNSVSNVSGAGEIYITTEENAGKIYIYIQDSGLSVRENKIEDIFELLSADRSSLAHELGMRYARSVIGKHNGEIEYMPGGGHGNIFQIVLPVFSKPPKRKKIDRNKLKKARILIIQPGDIAKELFAHLLAEKGCWVDKTGSTIDGLAAIKKKKINLLIADVEGAGVNNTAFWERCRNINSKLITVALKNGANINEHESSVEAGPDHIISKPFDIKDAVNRISEIFMVEY